MEDGKEERVRNVNCYRCGIKMNQKTARKSAIEPEGETLIWCSSCYRAQFHKRRKLIKRQQPFLKSSWLT